jgi:hypothetical protein
VQRFNPPPGWKVPPYPWTPPTGFRKEENWPDAPEGWQFWIEYEEVKSEATEIITEQSSNLDFDLLRAQIETELRSRVVELDDKLVLQEAGIYEYHHPLESADQYQEALEAIRAEIRDSIRNKTAILSNSQFAYDNSIAKGGKLVAELSGLAINAFNQEVENCLRTMKAGTLDTAVKRVTQSADKIQKFGRMMELSISAQFLALRIKELELTADYLAKVEAQKQLQREERERLREEEKARKELEAQREKLLKEEAHFRNALATLIEQGNSADAAVLESRLREVQEALELNDYRLHNVRAGYVYVISNEGAFGPGVLKIGMTRRLEPMERVNELGDASVPFRFSVHALFFSEDAVGLEGQLHEAFADRRLNQVNVRREFFFATPNEVREVLVSEVGALLQFEDKVISEEYLQSKQYWPLVR